MKTVQKIGINIFRILLTAASAIFAALLFGCSSPNAEMILSRTELSLAVGESRSILPYVSFSPATNTERVTLDTDSDCVSIDGTTVVAVKSGTADVKISAHGKTAVMKINVYYRAVSDYSVTVENGVQTVSGSAPEAVIFSAEFNGNVNPQTVAQWRVSDGTEYTGNRFVYTPKDYGVYSVTATVGDIVKSCDIKVYRPTEVTVDHTAMNDVTAYCPVTFTAYERVNTLNPRSVYEWRVNGEAMGYGPVFDYVPSVGRHCISLYVNGEQRRIDGKDELTLDIASDEYADCEVVFDDADGVYVDYAKERKVRYISIVDPNGKRSIFDVTDAQYAHLFTSDSFRATEYITVCAQIPKQYTIIIGTDGDRHEFVFTQLGANVKSYIENKVLCRNSFISSASDAAEYVRELYAVCAQSAQCYAATDTESVKQIIVEQAERLGLTVTVATDGNVIMLDFAPYANKPDKYEDESKNTSYAVLPHIEYNSDNRRSSDYVFSSDRAASSVSVLGSEQLLIAVSNRFKPVTQSGDIAQTVYRGAKTMLLRIIGKDYTPVQKVHAIYDWLQWVTVVADSVDTNSAGRFLEGVFGNASSGSGYIVTSEGAAKAFALLCGIEGIECVICYGEGYGYYNKVRLDGLWYNADVCGGKIKIVDPSTGVAAAVRFTSHRGLLISDADLARLGCDANDGYEAFDSAYSVYMQKYDCGGEYIDNYIDGAEIEYEAIRAVVYYAFNAVVRGNTHIPFLGGEVIIYNNTYGVELACDVGMDDAELNKVADYVNRAIDEYASEALNATFASRRTIIADGLIIAVAVSPRAIVQ